jgi:hypothetical protein
MNSKTNKWKADRKPPVDTLKLPLTASPRRRHATRRDAWSKGAASI